MDKLYQVFLSSTQTDLAKEREAVTRALQHLSCIAVSMERFPSSNAPKWDYMRRMIDKSDYFLLISAGRYGDVVRDDKSYTQLEYEYAIEQQKPTLIMFRDSVAALPKIKTEKTADGIKRLEDFRTSLAETRLIKRWSNKEELVSAVYASVSQLIRDEPAPGWVRAEDTSSLEVVLKLENEKLLLERELRPLRLAGLGDAVLSFYNQIDWHSLFEATRNLDLMFAYAQTWRYNNVVELERIAAGAGNSIRVLLPDPNCPLAVTVLAKRSRCDEEELKRRIQDAADQFKVLSESPNCKAEIIVKFLEFIPLYGLFSFDTGSVLVLHSHRDGRHGNPSFLLREGSIRGHLLDEFDRLFRSESGLRNAF